LLCCQNIAFPTTLLTLCIRPYKEVSLPQNSVCGLKCFDVGSVAGIADQQPYSCDCSNRIWNACRHYSSFVKVLDILTSPQH
jgi:hypothetical protein